MNRECRKRMRSEEDHYGLQLKCFVDQKILNQNNAEEMKLVHAKTMELLFQGARNHNKKNEMNNNVPLEAVDEKNPFLTEEKDCKLCNKQTILSFCKTCELEICQSCRLNCQFCSYYLCVNCVNLFGSVFESGPCCESCKLLLYNNR